MLLRTSRALAITQAYSPNNVVFVRRGDVLARSSTVYLYAIILQRAGAAAAEYFEGEKPLVASVYRFYNH